MRRHTQEELDLVACDFHRQAASVDELTRLQGHKFCQACTRCLLNFEREFLRAARALHSVKS